VIEREADERLGQRAEGGPECVGLFGQPFQGDFFRDSASRRAVDT
jgi:hypothetical protein